MRALRLLAIALVAVFAVLSWRGSIVDYTTSQGFVALERRTVADLALSLARTAVETGVIVVALVRGTRAGHFVRGVALLFAGLNLMVLLYFTPQYVAAIERWGASLPTLTLVVTYLAFGSALVQLLWDLIAARRATPAPS